MTEYARITKMKQTNITKLYQYSSLHFEALVQRYSKTGHSKGEVYHQT